MKNIKTSELQGQQLVDKVAEAQGWKLLEVNDILPDDFDLAFWHKEVNGKYHRVIMYGQYDPITDDAQAMEILDKMEDINFYGDAVVYYPSSMSHRAIKMRNGTRRENLLRCFVAFKLGDTVTVEGE